MNEKFALRVLIGALDLTGAEQGNVSAIDRKAGFLKIVAHRGAHLLREPVVVEDVMSDPRFASLRSRAHRERFGSVQSTPIIASNGELPGMTGRHAPTRRKIEQHELLAERRALAGGPKRCKRCGGTNLYVTEVLDPRTGKSFEVTRCVECDHVGWAEL